MFKWVAAATLILLSVSALRVLTGGALGVSGVATAAAPASIHHQRSLAGGGTTTATATTAAPATGIHKIKHVVIIMQENHSFDNYFGTYPGAYGIPGLAGNPGQVPCIPDPARGHCDAPYHEIYVSGSGGPHFNASAISDVDGGKMDGFAKTAEQSGAGGLDTDKLGCAVEEQLDCLDVMGYYNQEEIPNYWTYAKDFVLQDHMFEPVLSWSEVAHLYMVSGWSAQCANSDPESCKTDIQFPELPPGTLTTNPLTEELTGAALGIAVPVSPQVDYAWTDITYLLHKYNVPWKYYIEIGTEPDCETGAMTCLPTPQAISAPSIWNPLPSFEDVREDNQLGNIQPTTQFFTDAKNGDLPAVSWVIPSGDDSEHAPANIEAGQDHVTSVINAIMKSKDWDSTAIFVAWDDWGGYYDNIDPPSVDAEGYGIRVPGLVISPYAKQGYIDHQTLSFDAYLKFIEDDFLGSQRIDNSDGRPDPRPDVRESASILGNLVNDFDFNQTPRAPVLLNPNPTGKTLIGDTQIGTTGANPLTPDPDCARSDGTLAGTTLGPVTLGTTRTLEHRTNPDYFRTRSKDIDDVCLATGGGVRVGYLSLRRGAAATAVLALTDSKDYSYWGVSPGLAIGAALKLLGPSVGSVITRGVNRWYAVRRADATVFIRAAGGRVVEVGIAEAKVAGTREQQRTLLSELGA